MPAFYVHMLISVLWFFLWEPSLPMFLGGFLLGFLFLYIFQDFFQSRAYLQRWKGFIVYITKFTYAFITANLTIAYAVLTRKKEKITPIVLEYNVQHLRPWEIFLLSQSISLTPGTTTIWVDTEKKVLIIHAFDGDNPEEVCRSIKEQLERPLLRFMR